MDDEQTRALVASIAAEQAIAPGAVDTLIRCSDALLALVGATRQRRGGAPVVIGVCGSQGSGKSTAAMVVKARLEQGEGPAFSARVLTAPAGEPGAAEADGDAFALDLTGAYPLAAGEEWTRAFRFDAGRIEVTDSWRLRPEADGPAAVLHLVAAGEVRVDGDRVLVTADGAGIAIAAEGIIPSLEEWRLDDPELSGVWGERLTRLRYRLPRPGGSITMTVEELR